MAKDLLTILKEVRGTGAPEAEYTDGIYHDLTLKTTEDDGVTSRLGSGIYGSIQTMYSVVGVLVDMSDELAVLEGMSNELHSLYTDKAVLDSIYADKVTLDSIHSDKAIIDSIYTDKLTLDSLYADKLILDSLFTDKSKLDSLFTDKIKLDSLYADKAKLDSLYNDKTTLDSLYADKIALDRIYASIDSVDINANNIANINIAADNIADVNTVSTDIASVITAATNIADITNFADVYQGPKATEPTTRNDMTALVEGDMYFDTTIDRLRAYSGTVWISIAIIEHADLLGLQGGATGDYQHLTTAQLAIVNATSGVNTGDQTDITGNAGTVTNGVYTTDIGATVQAYNADTVIDANYISYTQTEKDKVANIPDNTDLILGTTTLTRFDKILGSMDIVDMEYTSGDLVTVRYEGDNDTNVFYRDVLAYTAGDLTTVKHYYNTTTLTTESGLTTLVYDVNKNLIGSNYTEG